MLQWGRDQMIAEIKFREFLPDGLCVASMGPRSNDRGNIFPRSWSTFILTRLQWGRDQMIAEMVWAYNVRKGRAELQWGRDQMIAEMMLSELTDKEGRLLQWGRDQMIAEIRRWNQT